MHNLVGIYGLPRGGTNYLCACLHYHPRLFSVSEREHDWRKPLARYWKRRSILREHGVQDKRQDQVEAITFNKVQRFPELWGPGVNYPDGTRLIFFLRHPLRVLQSRERFRSRHDPQRRRWADTEANFRGLLDETAAILDIRRQVRGRVRSMIVTYEHLALHTDKVMRQIQRFLGVDAIGQLDPRAFFKRCGKTGSPLVEQRVGQAPYLVSSATGERITGYGQFNPLRTVSEQAVRCDAWKRDKGSGRRIEAMRIRLGDELTDYYVEGRYDQPLRVAADLPADATRLVPAGVQTGRHR